MLAPKSIRFILPPLIIGLIVLFISQILSFLILGLTGYLIWFFRDPNREIIEDDSLIYAAADGKITFTSLEKKSFKMSIRMSPFDVHLNRSPIRGFVSSIEHTPGTHHNVYFGNVENKNERNLIEIKNQDVVCKILQITGAFARRIECWIDENEHVKQGQKIGIIRFGSQTNMAINLDQSDKSIKPLVKEGDKVYAGLTPVIKIESM